MSSELPRTLVSTRTGSVPEARPGSGTASVRRLGEQPEKHRVGDQYHGSFPARGRQALSVSTCATASKFAGGVLVFVGSDGRAARRERGPGSTVRKYMFSSLKSRAS